MNSQVRITKQSAAQRQIDAAIRMLFSGEDILAIYSVVAAADGVVSDLAKKRNIDDGTSDAARDTYFQLTGKTIPDDISKQWVSDLTKLIRSSFRDPANFLKHANRDDKRSLDPKDLDTDTLLLRTCAMYAKLGLEFTLEMEVFVKWHHAVYPPEDGCKIKTGSGYVHEMSRAHQIEFGNFLLSPLS